MIPVFHMEDKAAFFSRLETRRRQFSGRVLKKVRTIIEDVRLQGDKALLRWIEELDGIRMSAGDLPVSSKTLRDCASKADPSVIQELEKATFNIHAYHAREVQKSWEFEKEGVVLGQKIVPLGSVGIYIPGGSAAYPSSVLMNVIPAKIAGVPRIVVATPPRTFESHPIIAAALMLLNVREIYLMGGAQAVAALAYGTETVPAVDKITGPGNVYVAAAKREVYGDVAVDMIAGPSEVVILATADSNPRFIAADMLSQAEHDAAACAVCFTDSEPHAALVRRELEIQVKTLPRAGIAARSLKSFGAVVVLESYLQAIEWINRIAPEHLQIFSGIPLSAVEAVRSAGAVFYGDYSPEAVGDYFAGSNHVLPTNGTARFSSPLGVYDFQRRMSIVHYTREELARTWMSIARLAQAEGLEGHARSVRIRQSEPDVVSGPFTTEDRAP